MPGTWRNLGHILSCNLSLDIEGDGTAQPSESVLAHLVTIKAEAEPVVTECAGLARQETHNRAACVPLVSSVTGSLSPCASS